MLLSTKYVIFFISLLSIHKCDIKNNIRFFLDKWLVNFALFLMDRKLLYWINYFFCLRMFFVFRYEGEKIGTEFSKFSVFSHILLCTF